MILKTRHTGLVVRDLKKSLKFYKDILGLNIWKQSVEESSYIGKVVGIPKVKLEWVKLKADDGSLVELIQYHLPTEVSKKTKNYDANKLGCSHIAFTVDDVEKIYKILCKKGYVCKSSPQLSPDGLVKVMYCHDPDGIILELVEELNKDD